MAALSTLEASNLGGPTFTNINSHVCKSTCVWARSHVQPWPVREAAGRAQEKLPVANLQ